MFVSKYYQVIENKSEYVSFLWKACHIVFLLGAVVSSFLVANLLPFILLGFNNHCVLFSNLHFEPRGKRDFPFVGNFPYNRSFHNTQTIWSRTITCDTTEFIFILMSTAGVILLAFTIIISNGGVGETEHLYNEPYQMVIPTLLISLIAGATVSIAAVYVITGLDSFCSNFNEHPEDFDCGAGIDVYTLIYNKKIIKVSKHIKIARYSAKLAIAFWLTFILSLSLRILIAPDFTIAIYKIELIKKKRKSKKSEGSRSTIYYNEKKNKSSETDDESDLKKEMSESALQNIIKHATASQNKLLRMEDSKIHRENQDDRESNPHLFPHHRSSKPIESLYNSTDNNINNHQVDNKNIIDFNELTSVEYNMKEPLLLHIKENVTSDLDLKESINHENIELERRVPTKITD